jgi:phosphoribosylglycinamide formyltransferase 1
MVVSFKPMTRIAFFSSHNGSAAQAIFNACEKGILPAFPILLITNNPTAKALIWAKDAGLKTVVINAGNSHDPDQTIADFLHDHKIELGICSGYMKLIGPKTIAAIPLIINSHPALLPRFGGKGMYGRAVHQAVFDAREQQTGITLHRVDSIYDHGAIIAQKIIPLAGDDSVEEIEHKVKSAEGDFYIETLTKIFSGVLSP